MDDFKKIDDIHKQPFLEKGYDLYHCPLPFHLNRYDTKDSYNGEFMISANIDRTLLSVKQAVSDLQALIKWIKTNKKTKVILIGVSLGGFITNLTATLTQDIDLLVSLFYANSLAFSIWHSCPGKYIKKDFTKHNFSYEKLQSDWAVINPMLSKPLIPKENILLISGQHDKYVLCEDTDALFCAWDKPHRLLYPCGHAGIIFLRKRILKDTLAFIEKHEKLKG